MIALLCAVLAWLLARSTPAFAFALPARILIAIVLALAGVSLALSGMAAFRKADTTVNPRSPDQASSIVRNGPFQFTRNPMYLGLALVLLGFCAYLANPLSVVAVVVFVAYITRFQIIPEERVLLEKFGEPFAQYMRSVRRWI
ncbi:MAG: isoprenylcysteine carboxylmethyltransferase family protein [Dokdonella sp.]